MRSVGVSAWRKAAFVTSVLAVGAGVLIATADPAEAGRRRRHRVVRYSPPPASMVVDAKTGHILQASNPDALRHPASITKVMTLYLLFEQLERGRYTLSSPLRVSAHAASQAPSKLGLRPGDTIEVEDAIKAVVTKSANDVAVVIAENVAGSEDAFAEQMTRRARALGMSRTTYANASGLPNPEQITTARDLVTLGRAIQDRFPRYYQYFATRSFEYNGAVYGNHNKLLGRLEGVDGIKTGYTRASGFNLLTSVKAGGRHIVAVVLGGRSGRSRDIHMANLVDSTMGRAYAGLRSAPPVGESAVAVAERIEMARPEPVRVAVAEEAAETRATPATTASIAPPRPVGKPLGLANVRPVAASASATPALAARTPPPRVENTPAAATAFAPVRTASAETMRPPGDIRSAAAPHPVRQTAIAAPAKPLASPPPAVTAVPKNQPAAKPGAGWVIQLGAIEDQGKAQEMLARAKSRARGALAKASPFTEKITKDGAVLYRARFAGFDSDEAQAACRTLKRDGFNCFAARG